MTSASSASTANGLVGVGGAALLAAEAPDLRDRREAIVTPPQPRLG